MQFHEVSWDLLNGDCTGFKILKVICSSFVKFLEFAGKIYRYCYCDQKIVIDILCRSGDAVIGNAPKNGEPTVAFSFTTMLQHTGLLQSRIS
jgi:hypothetical protein